MTVLYVNLEQMLRLFANKCKAKEEVNDWKYTNPLKC